MAWKPWFLQGATAIISGMRVCVGLCAAAMLAACSSSDDGHVTFDFKPVQRAALEDGQRVDAGLVIMTSGGATTTTQVDPATLLFDIDLPVGSAVAFEAITCLGTDLLCVTNYWGALATTLSRTDAPVSIDVYEAGQLSLDVRRFDQLDVPADLSFELRGANPRSGHTSFRIRAGEKINLPVDRYTVIAEPIVDGGLTLDLDPQRATLDIMHGASLTATMYFGSCTGSEDLDGDGVACAVDCDESSSDCAADCSDLDSDGTPDCRDDCIDNDRDRYGVGRRCLGADCDDRRADIAPGQPEVCNGVDNDCDPSTVDDGVCTPVCEETRIDTLRLGPAAIPDCRTL